MAAGIAATRGKLNKLFRVWTIGNGIGFAASFREGIGKAAFRRHLDPRKISAAAAAKAISKGILGRRSIVCVSWILEPEKFLKMRALATLAAREFVTLCHRARPPRQPLAFTWKARENLFRQRPEVKFIDVGLLDRPAARNGQDEPAARQPLRVVPTSDEMGIVGAAVNADHATSR